MTHHILIAQQLERNAETIRSFVKGVNETQARWRPTPDDWSILEVINHLYDEEREDFRQRIDYTLHKPGEPWPPIDPAGWVSERKYNERILAESLANFLRERQQSVYWLGQLTAPDWNKEEHHPAGFTLKAGDLLSSWLAHDFLHLRQLNELQYAWVKAQAEPFNIEYAGDW